MSGFIAIVNTNGTPVNQGVLEELTASLHYRGPDQQQVWTDGAVGLGHTLFRTTDEAQYENQPASLDGEVWITGCIRIDARKELVNKLGLADKVKLAQISDSELFLHAYRAWGEKCLDHLLGDFAFALWDRPRQQLFCGKDRFGMRQLYYAHIDGKVVVSNSLHCMLSHPDISKRLDDKAIGYFLLFGDHNWIDKSISAFADVKVLLPAHKMTVHNRKIAFQKYWDLPLSTELLNYRNEIDYVDHFQEVFSTAVADRIRTKSAVISMSGGMDSTAIAATAQEVMECEYQSPDLNAVTVVYDKLHKCEERYYANLAAKKLRLPIHLISGDNYPFSLSSFQTTRPYEYGQLDLWLDIRKKQCMLGKVVLTGAAADNLLRFPSASAALREGNIIKALWAIVDVRMRYGSIPGLGLGLRSKLKSKLQPSGSDLISSAYPYPSWINQDFEENMCLKERWNEFWKSQNQPAYKQSRYSLLNESLVRPDWCSEEIMMKSDFTLPEVRDPFLDMRMVDFVLSLPTLPWLFNKDILRKSMEEKLPREVIYRPKTGLGTIHSSILRPSEPSLIDEWESSLELHRYIDREKVSKLAGSDSNPGLSYVNLRPVLLNSWLENIQFLNS